MLSFLLFFGVANVLTPVVMLSTTDNHVRYDIKQKMIMRNMFICGVCLVFIALCMMLFV